MKSTLKNVIAGIAVLAGACETQAVVGLSFDPLIQTTPLGGSAAVNLVVSGLGNLASPSLGGFFIDFSYNPAVVSLSSLTFGTELDLGVLGSIQGSDTSTPGLVHLDEVSFEAPDGLNGAQPDSFTLATIQFTGAAPGLSPLVFGAVSLSDETGATIAGFTIDTGLITVPGGHIPDGGASALLLGGAVAGLLSMKKRLAQAN